MDTTSNLPLHKVGWNPPLKFTVNAEIGSNLAAVKKFRRREKAIGMVRTIQTRLFGTEIFATTGPMPSIDEIYPNQVHVLATESPLLYFVQLN